MKFKDAKEEGEGKVLTLLEMDNLFCVISNNSLFGCSEGREAINRLIKEGKSNFSYADNYWGNGEGYCVEFKLISPVPESSDFADSAETVVEITDIWEY